MLESVCYVADQVGYAEEPLAVNDLVDLLPLPGLSLSQVLQVPLLELSLIGRSGASYFEHALL